MSGRAKPWLLIADHEPTRRGVRMAVADAAQICAEAGDATEAIAAAECEQPDVCMVGVEIPGGGIVAVHGICAVAPRAAVVVLAGSIDVDEMVAAVRAGAVGYVPGNIEPAPLQRVIAAVAAGEAALPRAMVLELALEVRDMTSREADGLTRRETQVLHLIQRGGSTADIAERLSISPVTVRRHISALVQKLGADDRAALSAAGPRRVRQ